ncbi:MAG: type II secretion system protein GspE, partial [Culicoidibacterales bacterium]
SSISGIIAQRLVRKNCPHCIITREATDYEKTILHHPQTKSLQLQVGVGCGHCNNVGYYGRVGVYEIMTMNETLRQAVATQATPDQLRTLAIKEGMTTLADECRQLVLAGETTVDELLKIVLA